MKSIKLICLQTFLIWIISLQSLTAQTDTAYSFIVAGHAYGAHSGGNLGLHPAFLSSLNSGFDPNTAFFVFTGDIVNVSSAESWQQVEDEMNAYGLPYYYSMGNHGDNTAGWQEFEDRYGSTYYSYYSQSDLFIVLNSVESGRSISSNQLVFLEEQLALVGENTKNIFVFFHEILWNSNEKYIGVRSNSRSRYDQIAGISNYWQEVHPLFEVMPEKNFYVITGDVGGNPDAIAAFYDTWNNVTLISSGMGEVADENYLQVNVLNKENVEFELKPLNSDLTLPGIEYYSVPPSPDTIIGPIIITTANISGLEYSVPEVFNAESYIWDLPAMASGSSSSGDITVDFEAEYLSGEISVKAYRDGFGSGSPAILQVDMFFLDVEQNLNDNNAISISAYNNGKSLCISLSHISGKKLTLNLVDIVGRKLKSEEIQTGDDYMELQYSTEDLQNGILLLSVSTDKERITEKIIMR